MSEVAMSVSGMLLERLRMVQDLSRINARHLLNQQIAGGAEFTIMRMEREMRDGAVSEAGAAALQEELDRRDKAKRAMAADDEAISSLEQQLEELDRRIAAVGRE